MTLIKRMITTLSSATLLVGAAGCSTSYTEDEVEVLNSHGKPLVKVFTFHTHQLVSDYTDRLAHDLVSDYRGAEWDSPLVITKFNALQGESYSDVQLGLLVSESLVGQIQKYQIPVVVGYTNSKDELTDKAKYILYGVLVENERGYEVNARILDSTTQVIVSSATTIIPKYVVESL
ncbi:FlgO family outer membrane protein [Psychrobium sp. 1_MG-2023]|uniref:FlgO family outer membrane protein n=1 Tax=Psychrobium sp. 1_MG-2023 TaxID=3062624 RepID=UPI000C327DFD|nr:FlgO family outer membrane protein [Psychrobium sp. 1_MG-2023]MDP2559901.1 FlgO family outer membrane protein [Psychrobium sp. 1_MG-2023]PKF58998.1 hypothetical protein CW748_02075 [Alteromonadales bacterium alter-6D02]